jgi:hypothetical protein
MDTSAFPIDASRGLHILAAAYSDSTARVCTMCYELRCIIIRLIIFYTALAV